MIFFHSDLGVSSAHSMLSVKHPYTPFKKPPLNSDQHLGTTCMVRWKCTMKTIHGSGLILWVCLILRNCPMKTTKLGNSGLHFRGSLYTVVLPGTMEVEGPLLGQRNQRYCLRWKPRGSLQSCFYLTCSREHTSSTHHHSM